MSSNGLDRSGASRGIDSERGGLDRRQLLALGAGAFAWLAVPAAFHSPRRLVRRSVPLMGTIAEIGVVGRDETAAQRAIEAALGALRRVEAAMTRFHAGSDVGRANLAAAGVAVPVSEETAEVVAAALRWAGATCGRFDPCLERATALWDTGTRSEPPPAERLARLRGRQLHRALELERPAGGAPRVRLHLSEAGLDLGGIAKGFGVDRAVEALRAQGVEDALVNVGGDLYALGRSPDGDRWAVGVRSPADPERLATTLEASDLAIATSGDYFRFFTHGGTRYHHLLDPVTAAPRPSRRHSATVAAASCLGADAGATAVFGCEPEEARPLLASDSSALLC
jgi:thiamine biosynthesis lipoprotein